MTDINIIQGQEVENAEHCIYCSQRIAPGSRYCSHCGKAQAGDLSEVNDQKLDDIKQLAAFFVVESVICCSAHFIKAFKTISWSITFDVILAVIAIAFFSLNWSKTRSLLLWRNFSLFRLVKYVVIAALCSFIVSFFVGWLNQTLFSKEFSYYAFYSKYSYGKVLMIFFTAIMPALFEELGYRGFLLQNLLQVVDKNQAIFISAFLFAIMHMSFISLVWLLPFGLFLAYVRTRQNTLWYGIFIHFTFNFTACMIELYKFHH